MSIYRQYEDPWKLEKMLAEARAEYDEAVANGVPAEVLMDISMGINELKERINFAWQDDEYDSEY